MSVLPTPTERDRVPAPKRAPDRLCASLILVTLMTAAIANGAAVSAEARPGSGDPIPSQQLPTQIAERQEDTLAKHLAPAHGGNPDSIEAVLRLAGGGYINSAEGGEFLNATYMDLLIAHPLTFLSVLARQEAKVKDRVIQELRRPVHDAYSAGDLLAAVRLAIRRGVDDSLATDLEQVYAELERHEGESFRRRRDDLDAAADACVHWGGEEAGGPQRAADILRGFERDCGNAVAMARENLSMSPRDPVVGAIAIDLAGYLGGTEDAEIFRSESFKSWACGGAAFYHRAMAQYERYEPRSRDYLAAICPEEAANLPPL